MKINFTKLGLISVFTASAFLAIGTLAPLTSFAASTAPTMATSPFTTSFGYGSRSSDVSRLQNILITQGFLSADSATGNYFALTQKAVADFQKARGISTTGYFGPLTRAMMNKILGGQISSLPAATVSLTSVKTSETNSPVTSANSTNNGSLGASQAAAAFLSLGPNPGSSATIPTTTKTITWQTAGYPNGIGLNINLIRKISDNPRSYTFIRTIAKNTPNDGSETWTPLNGEDTISNLYVEITCSTDYSFAQGCQVSSEPVAVQ